MSRLGELPEERFIGLVEDLTRHQEQLKTFQPSGSDSVLMQRIFSDNAADITITNVDFDSKAFNLVFTPDDTTLNTSLVYKMEYTYTEGTGNTVEIFVERQKVEAGNVQKWLFALLGSDFFPNSEVTIKFYFWASGPGTFSTVML